MKTSLRPDRYLLRAGILLLAGGLLAGGYGIYRWFCFMQAALYGEEEPGLGLVAFGLILPHIFTFLGIGITIYGLILTVKAIRFRRLQRRP